ncbi:DNA topoisomerase, partial [Burkholderia pseudomallei]|uniref:DNA topoisomerase n=1 Tax=Burkholderia pseudomallei TaxID=28450 RepID=UPI003CEC93BE
LRLVVDRDGEIERFVAVSYWSIEVELRFGGQSFTAHWLAPDDATDDEGRCLQQHLAQMATASLQSAREVEVTDVATERVSEASPLPFDLGTLQEVCSRQLGLDVQATLDIAQSLYETHKATTYPRTNSGYLPESMLADVPTVLAALVATDPSVQPLVATLDRSQRSRAWNDAKITAHHGIIP